MSEDRLGEIKSAFDLFDHGKTGKINRKQVGTVMRAVGLNPSDDNLEKLLQNKSDDITLDDLIEMITDPNNKDAENFDDLRVAFRVFDREGEVSVSKN